MTTCEGSNFLTQVDGKKEPGVVLKKMMPNKLTQKQENSQRSACNNFAKRLKIN